MAYKAPASSRLALLQGSGRLVHHIRSKSAHENNIVRWGQKRSRTSSACSVGTSAGIVVFRITRSQGARHNTSSGTPLHHSRRRLCAESISLCRALFCVHPSEIYYQYGISVCLQEECLSISVCLQEELVASEGILIDQCSTDVALLGRQDSSPPHQLSNLVALGRQDSSPPHQLP